MAGPTLHVSQKIDPFAHNSYNMDNKGTLSMGGDVVKRWNWNNRHINLQRIRQNSRLNAKKREEVKKDLPSDVDDFLANGGKIRKYPSLAH